MKLVYEQKHNRRVRVVCPDPECEKRKALSGIETLAQNSFVMAVDGERLTYEKLAA